jgi:hypothetical protein
MVTACRLASGASIRAEVGTCLETAGDRGLTVREGLAG